MRKLLLFLLCITLCATAAIQAQNNCCIGENLGGICLGEDNCESFVPRNCDTLNNRCFQKWWTWPGTAITAEDYVPSNLVSSRRYEGSRALHMKPDANGATPDVVKDLFDLSSGIHRLSWKMYVPTGKTGYFNIQHDFRRLMRGQPNWAYQVFFTPDGSVQVRVGAEGTFRVASFKPDCWLKVTQVINLDRDSVHFFLNNRLVARWKFSFGVVDLDNDNRGDQKIVDRKLGAIDFYANTGFEYYIDKICYQQAPSFTGGPCPTQGQSSYCLGGVTPYSPANACGLPAYDGYVEGEEVFAGACNPGVSACADAIPIACGQSLSNQTTGGIGAKNTFSSKDFSSCVATQNAYGGNDKVYRITITEPTNLQATLNILDAGRNLDMFLLSSCLTYPLATTSQPECAYCLASSTNNNLSNPEESFSMFLEPGIYYLVVDAPQAGVSARFDLALSCGCSCVEGGDTPLGPNVLCENFDVYNNGNLVSQSPRWKLWDAASNDGLIVATTDRAGKALRIQRAATDPDVLFPLGNRTTGRYRLSFNVFVTKGASGYYNIQHTDAGGANPNWAFEIDFQSNSLGRLIVAKRVVGTFYYKNGDWNKTVQIIDLDKDKAELWINDQMVHSWRFSQGTTGDLKQLGAINFYANTGNDILVDNICMFAKETSCTDASLNPVCLSDGRSYRNETQARCDLYTSAELGACISVCDLGGTMIYRGDRFSGTLTTTDQAPNLSWQDSCVTATFAQQSLDSLFGHSYVFYNDEANPFSISLTATNGARAFIYRCSQDGVSSNSARFRCIGRDGETFSQKGYFYVLIMGPKSNSTYAFSVLPEASCRLNPTEIACNVPVANTLSGASRYGIGVGGSNVYQTCYQGGRTYAGSDREFSFRLTKPGKVSVSIQGQAGLGIFLYDFLCGKNCIGFAETNDQGALARTDTMMLNAGVYYVIVDQAISGSNGAFTLTVNCSDYTKTIFLQETGAATCAVNASGRHNVVFRSLRNSRINGQRLNVNDQLHFFYQKNNRGDLLSTTANWTGTELQVSLPQDAIGDTLKCGYFPDELLKIRLSRNNVSYDITPQYQPIDGVGVTAGNRFAGGGTSLITELSNCCAPHSLRVSPSHRELNGQGGVAEFKVASNMAWTVRKAGTSPWIKISTEAGFANDILRVEIDPNNTNADRQDTLFVLGPDNEIQKVVVAQSRSSCAAVAVNLGPDRQICRGQALNLSATGVGNFLWSTGQTGAAISVNPQVNATYAVTITQNGCSGVDEVNVTVNEIPVVDLGQDLQLCSGDNIVFVATGGIPTAGAMALLPQPFRYALYKIQLLPLQ
ncbi:MAG: BACON domain-containing protein [Haliscomenobacter sp.]|nr:BACON domain-containing protein [Haliscomenobacter sp.]MBK9491392.1 BACON domain-containing protein [Haliscomenobacter sp.]